MNAGLLVSKNLEPRAGKSCAAGLAEKLRMHRHGKAQRAGVKALSDLVASPLGLPR